MKVETTTIGYGAPTVAAIISGNVPLIKLSKEGWKIIFVDPDTGFVNAPVMMRGEGILQATDPRTHTPLTESYFDLSEYLTKHPVHEHTRILVVFGELMDRPVGRNIPLAKLKDSEVLRSEEALQLIGSFADSTELVIRGCAASPQWSKPTAA